MKEPKHIPTIHLNGTGALTLQTDALAIARAAEALEKAMQDAEFNARDYYPQGPGAFEAARTALNAEMRVVGEIKDRALWVVNMADEHLNRKDPLRQPRGTK